MQEQAYLPHADVLWPSCVIFDAAENRFYGAVASATSDPGTHRGWVLKGGLARARLIEPALP